MLDLFYDDEFLEKEKEQEKLKINLFLGVLCIF